jgi:hypothetical protein
MRYRPLRKTRRASRADPRAPARQVGVATLEHAAVHTTAAYVSVIWTSEGSS